MKKAPANPALFEYRTIKEILEDDGLPVAEEMKLQVRLFELSFEIKAHNKKLLKEKLENFRRNAIDPSKRINEREMTDLRAFKHFLSDRTLTKNYKVGTLKKWNTDLNKGKVPSIVDILLKKNGYKVVTTRKWLKPRAK